MAEGRSAVQIYTSSSVLAQSIPCRSIPCSMLCRSVLYSSITLALCAVSLSADDTTRAVTAHQAADAISEPITASSEVIGEPITLELIMSDPDWIGNAPTDPYWSDDNQAVYFEQKRAGEKRRDLIRIDLTTGTQTVVADQDRGATDIEDGQLSPDRTHKTYSRRGDIYVKHLTTGAVTQLTRTAAEETDARFMADGRQVMFRRGNAVFVRSLDNGLEVQAADLRLTRDPADDDTKNKDKFLASQQLRLFDIVKQRKHDAELEREQEQHEQSEDPTRPPLPFYLGEDLEILGSTLSPAGDGMLLVVADKKRELGRQDQMPDWVTDTGYVATHEVRPKVGTARNVGQRLIYLDLDAHEVHELDLSVLPGIADDPLAELREQARQTNRDAAAETEDQDSDSPDSEDDKGAEDNKDTKPVLRDIIFELPPAWSPDGQQLIVQAHSYDNKDRWLALVDVNNPSLAPVHRLTNEAWINWSFNEFGWLSDSRRFYFLSEESGYSQLYLYTLGDKTLSDGGTQRLTDGDYVVSDVVLSPDETQVYYTANVDQPGIYETYRVDIASGRIEQLTALGGRSSFELSPDGETLLLRHSSITRPPELYLQPAQPGAEARRLTHTVNERFSALPWVAPEIVEIPSTHQSRPIYSRFYPAQGTAPATGHRPAVVFVHGAGYLQNAHHGWSGYFREFMFHTFLSQRGYAVLDMDYRASAGYGAEWRTAIYRQMGTPELEDLQDGVAWLTSEHSIDRQKIGVYGGSYGGFMTMMALFKDPDLFACGAALRPVTDWAHYNHPYTSNILNTPAIDPEAYQRSSPIEFAEGLDKPLLICAPMQDDNVFFQDTVRLAQRLIELEKEDWEVAIFPIEPHGFREPSSWLNEYRRIFKLFETHLGP